MRTRLLRIAVSDKADDDNVLSNLCRASMALVIVLRSPLSERTPRPLSSETHHTSYQKHNDITNSISSGPTSSYHIISRALSFSTCPLAPSRNGRRPYHTRSPQTSVQCPRHKKKNNKQEQLTPNPRTASFSLNSPPNWLKSLSSESSGHGGSGGPSSTLHRRCNRP